jgi:3-phosphoshikimate 1-carboxyvinyltransferase
MASTLVVRGPASLSGRARPPPDKSVAHRTLLFAALADGESVVRPYVPGRDVEATATALRRLGVRLETRFPGELRVVGAGPPPDWPRVADVVSIDCGNSGTTLRLLAGLLAGRPGRVRFDGDASLRRRPMERLRPLERMGARFSGSTPLMAPFELEGVARPRGIEAQLDVASAQVKSALLLAGLFADGETVVAEPGPSRDHTERWLRWLGVSVERTPGEQPGAGRVALTPIARPWAGRGFEVPPDFSSAAFLLAAAVVTGSREVQVACGTNPTRTGFLDLLAVMGVEVERRDDPPLAATGPEPLAELAVRRSGSLVGATIAGELTLRAIDELPLIMGLAAFAEGTTELRDAAELRVKESDRLEAMRELLTAFGVACELRPDGAVVRGGVPRPAIVDAAGDHRIAMTAAVVGLGAEGVTQIRGAEVVDVSYPGFVDTLQALGADAEWVAS